MANIKKIKGSNNTNYEIEALHFVTGTLDTPAQWKEYIDSSSSSYTETDVQITEVG